MSFKQPKPVSKVDLVFGGNMKELMPKYEEIPAEFKDFNKENRWTKLQSKWFFEGLKKNEIPKTREGIDQNQALTHLQAIQASWEPKHEHKVAAVAYLMSLWFE